MYKSFMPALWEGGIEVGWGEGQDGPGSGEKALQGILVVSEYIHFWGSMLSCLGVLMPFMYQPGSADINFETQFICDLL